MQQQLIEQTIQITPQTMHQVLPKLTQAISQSNLSEQSMETIVKSIFYGLWNFDKMINQHNLSTEIADILNKVPKKSAFIFLNAIFTFLKDKWNYIDHHRINKFMQLTRYLLKQGLRVSQKKTDQTLKSTIFSSLTERSGISDHIIEVYYDSLIENHSQSSKNNDILNYQKLEIFENILRVPTACQHIREHIIEQIYQKHKKQILESASSSSIEKVLQKINEFNSHIIEVANTEQDDICRKALYTLVGYMKSDQTLFSVYLEEKNLKLQTEKQAKTKKISKFKKEIIKETKQKRKEKNKTQKRSKILSRPKFEFTARQHLQQIID